jgi:hypothetical protein
MVYTTYIRYFLYVLGMAAAKPRHILASATIPSMTSGGRSYGLGMRTMEVDHSLKISAYDKQMCDNQALPATYVGGEETLLKVQN